MPIFKNPLTKAQKVSIVVILIVVITVSAFFGYIFIDRNTEKTEFLSPEERWQITEASYDEDKDCTHFGIKFLGENRATMVVAQTTSRWSALWDEIETLDCRSFGKGETNTFTVDGYTYELSIRWDSLDSNSTTTIKLDVLPLDDYEY